MVKLFLCLLCSFAAIGAEARLEIETELRDRSLQYFIENTHPVSGLIRDRSRNDGGPMGYDYQVSSLAATGFGLTVLAHAAATGLLPKAETQKTIERTLNFVLTHLEHHHGWFYHFVDWETGARAFGCEVSTIDSAFFFAGALYAAAVFPGTPLQNLAQQLYERADFHVMLTNGGQVPGKLTLTMGWAPEVGYLPWDWNLYSEHMILLILGLGHPSRPLPKEAWTAWGRADYGLNLPLFIHQYSHLFLDFRTFNDGYQNYFEASVKASQWNRTYCLTKPTSNTFAAGLWGLSASGSAQGYYPFSPAAENGTVCLGCAVASLPFLPSEIRQDLAKWEKLSEFPSMWGKYGFNDSTNLDRTWHDPDALGITVAPVYFALAALGPDPISNLFSKIPAVERGLSVAATH